MPSVFLRIPFVLATFALIACGGDDDGNGSGGASGAAGQAGQAGAAGSTVEPATMVQLPAGFSVDSTEVTRAQYRAWLDTSPPLGTQIPECSWNDSYTPGCQWPPGDEADHPVVCVDWCDAYAYCQGVGKRLCGKIGGGPTGANDHFDPALSQWTHACSSGGLYRYPYGDTYTAGACNIDDPEATEASAVASFPDCQSPESGYQGVFDMVGNVLEWEDSCGASTGPEDGCGMRGGAFGSGTTSDCSSGGSWPRRSQIDGFGFRCCRD